MGNIEIICTVIMAVIAVIGGIWAVLSKVFKLGKISQRIDEIEKNNNDIKNSISNLPCGNHHEDITKIKTILVEKYPKSVSVFSMKCSPRRLNEWGEKLYEKVGGKKFIEDNKTALFDYIKKSKPLVALDVEQASNAACQSLIPTPAFNRLKDFVYNEPSWDMPGTGKYDITVNDVCFVIGLKLRDLYLEEIGLQ